MTRSFTNTEKLFIIHEFLKTEGTVTLEQFKQDIAAEFKCDSSDINIIEWSNSLDLSSANGWKDRLFRALGGIGGGMGIGAPGFTVGAFIYCAVKEIPFALANASYESMVLGFIGGFIIGAVVGYRTTTPLIQTLNDWRIQAYNKYTGKSVDLEAVERDLELGHRQELQGTGEEVKKQLAELKGIVKGYEKIAKEQSESISRLTKNNERLEKYITVKEGINLKEEPRVPTPAVESPATLLASGIGVNARRKKKQNMSEIPDNINLQDEKTPLISEEKIQPSLRGSGYSGSIQ